MVKPQVRHSIAGTLDYFAHDPALTEDERRGIWLGKGVELSGLQVGSFIKPEDLECYLHGYSPSGQRLFAVKKENRRCAWDCVVTAEKATSVAALCSNEYRSVQAAFRIAVMCLIFHLESLAYRQDNAGSGLAQPTRNLIAAKFVHHASRHADPHVHAHLLLINATHGPSGWRSLEPANIYRNQTSLRWVFNAELHRQFSAFGLRSTICPDGITRLPVPKEICVKYSRAHAAIAKMAADMLLEGHIPPEWEKLPPPELINRLNDRSRPARRPLRADWQQLLSGEEKAQVSQLLVDTRATPIAVERPPAARDTDSLPAIPPPPPKFHEDPEFYEERAKELLGKTLAKTSLYYRPHTIKITTCRVAAAHPDIPLGAFARAAHWCSEHRPSVKVFSRATAEKLENISRHLLHSRANHNLAQSVARVESVKSLSNYSL